MSNNLPTEYSSFIHLSRYSRWLYDKNRRETWEETVARYFDFFEKHLKKNCEYDLTKKTRSELEQAVLGLEIMPSMRCMMTAGEALERSHIAGYNCAYLAIDNLRSFDELLFVLLNGTGVGYSVEHKFVDQLPIIAEDFHDSETTIVVPDSKLGWAKSFRELVHLLYGGQIPKWDLSRVRPAGAPLKTFGGRASGPGPLEELFKFAVKLISSAAGRRLSSLECHDLVCKTAEIVVVGGVRRAALISLSDLFDDNMRLAKSGQWWDIHPHRALANNSYVAKRKPDIGIFMKEWLSLYESKSGERGIFSRAAAKAKIESVGRRSPDHEFGCNPCSEILLRSREFCNLSEVIVRPTDSVDDLKRKVRLAAILGTFQSTLTNFPYLSKKWKENCDEERLLGVSLTGIMDNAILNGSGFANGNKKGICLVLDELREYAVETNKTWAANLGIPQSGGVTCVKPSGTVSQLTDSASGIHARHAPYYIRTVRADKKDPLCAFMTKMGFPVEDELHRPDHTAVFSFPQKGPENAVFRQDMDAITQLEIWLIYARHWAEHKPSVTVTVKEDEWVKVGAWVWDHFGEMSGVSFLPFSDHVYKQAPYQDCTKEEYEALLKKMPKNVDWKSLSEFEKNDMTVSSQTLACSGDVCEVVDIG